MLLVGLVLAGCATSQKKDYVENVRKKEIFITFPAWVSEEEKKIELTKKAAVLSLKKCKSNQHKIVNIKSMPFSPDWTSTMHQSNYIEADIKCNATQIVSSTNSKVANGSQDTNSLSADFVRAMSDREICVWAVNGNNWDYTRQKIFQEAKRRGLSCGVGEASGTEIASSTSTPTKTPSSAELEAERQKRIKLEQQLVAIKAQQEQQQQTISSDTQIPLITIASANTKGKQGVIRGRASDNVGVAEVTIDGNAVAVQSNGSFEYSTFVPATGLTVTVQATDMAGLSSKQTVSLQRNVNIASASISFDRLNPIGKPALKNKDAIALIIGIGSYENIIDAAYADKDALMFRDYAAEKLGIPESRIKTLINEDADIGEVLLGIRKWIRRSTKPDKTDVFVFYAGHGIATATGEAYILPYDGRPEVDLLDRTALLQKELFAEIDKANPRNVTIFLDACYTGKARTGEVLMADANYRPIAIRPIDDGMPDNFTLITASSGDEFSGPLEEAKHGLFSYFLMKGMEGDADSNQDGRITAGELHQFVKENVLRQSADKQTPELQGNANRVLVTFK